MEAGGCFLHSAGTNRLCESTVLPGKVFVPFSVFSPTVIVGAVMIDFTKNPK